MLIIPNRHGADYFAASAEEKAKLWAMVDEGKNFLAERFRPDGFNVGINVSTTAGQTVMHCHIHLTPRRSGNSVNPCGGVRGVIAGQAGQKTDTKG